MTAEDVARRWRSQAPTSHDVYPRATEDVANLECRMNNAHGRSNAPSRTTPQGRRRPSRMCYPKAREQEENPSSWPSLPNARNASWPSRVQAQTEGLPHLEASLRPPWPPTWILLKLVSPSHLETADECTYLGLLARTATPPPCYRGPIGELSPKAVSRETLKNTVRTPKRPLFALNLHQKSSAKTTNFKA